MGCHPSHKTRISMDASSYDEICDVCGATDVLGGWGKLAEPCPGPPIVAWDKEYKPSIEISEQWRTMPPKVLETINDVSIVARWVPADPIADLQRMLSKLVTLTAQRDDPDIYTRGVQVLERRYGISITLTGFVPTDMIESEQPISELMITPTHDIGGER